MIRRFNNLSEKKQIYDTRKILENVMYYDEDIHEDTLSDLRTVYSHICEEPDQF